MWFHRSALAAALLSATIAAACTNGDPVAKAAESTDPTSENAGTLSVTALRFSGWHDEMFHYLPALSVTAPTSGRPVFVQRVDFTAEDTGTRRLLKGIAYHSPPRVQPGSTVELVSDADAAITADIASPMPLASISVMVLFTDDEGQSGIVSAESGAPEIPAVASLARLEIREFSITGSHRHGRFFYWPKLTLAESSGGSRATIRKIEFALLDGSAAAQTVSVWRAPDVPAGAIVRLATNQDDQTPWFEIDSARAASHVSVVIAFVDEARRGGVVSAMAPIEREP